MSEIETFESMVAGLRSVGLSRVADLTIAALRLSLFVPDERGRMLAP